MNRVSSAYIFPPLLLWFTNRPDYPGGHPELAGGHSGGMLCPVAAYGGYGGVGEGHEIGDSYMLPMISTLEFTSVS